MCEWEVTSSSEHEWGHAGLAGPGKINPGWDYRGRHKAGTRMERSLVCRKVPDSGLPNQKDSFQVSPESDPFRGTFRWGPEGGLGNQRSREYLDSCP